MQEEERGKGTAPCPLRAPHASHYPVRPHLGVPPGLPRAPAGGQPGGSGASLPPAGPAPFCGAAWAEAE